MRRLVLVVFCAVVAIICSAQNDRIVKGAVFATDGTPLSAVVLKVVGTEQTFTSKDDGTFQVQVPYYVKMIEASAEGYLTEQVEVDGSYMIFKLKVDKKYLENKAKAEEAARVAESEKAKAEEAAKAKAEEEARKVAEAKAKAEAAAKSAAEKEAIAKAKAEEAAKAKAEEEARKVAEAKAKAEEAARISAFEKAKKDSIAKVKVAEQARLDILKKAKTDSLAKAKAEKRESRISATEKYNQKYRNKGLVHNLELNYSYPLVGVNTVVYQNYGIRNFSTLHPVELNYSIGYRFCNWVSVSLGAGVTYDLVDLRNYGDSFAHAYETRSHRDNIQPILNYSNMSIPVFMNARFYLTKGSIQPITSISGGIYLPIPTLPLNNMLFFDAGVGCNFRVNKRSNIYVIGSIATVPAIEAGLYDPYSNESLWIRRRTVLSPRIKVGFTL